MRNDRNEGNNSDRTAQHCDSAFHIGFNTICDPVFILDREGTILEANKAFAMIFGKTVQECLNANVYDLLPPTLAVPRREKAEEAFRTSRLVMFEDERDGHFIRHSIAPIADKHGRISQLYITSQDITDLKIAERESKKLQTVSDAIIEAIPGAFYMLDAEGRYVKWNAYQRDVVVGKPDSEMVNTSALDTIHPDDRALIHEKMVNILKHGVEDNEEVRVLIQGGPTFRWFRISGKKIIINGDLFIIGIGSDITERKIAEEKALRDSENRFRMLFEGHSYIMVVIDDLGHIIDANPAASAFYGWPIEELCNLHIDTITTTKYPETTASILEKVKTSKQNRFSSLQRRSDGSIRDVEVVSNRIEIQNRIIFYCIINDITERKLADNQLKKLSAAVEQSPVSVVITDLVGDIEYVNNYFTLLTGYTLEESIGKNPRILKSDLMPESIYEDLWLTILSGKVWRGELQNKKKNGELYWETATISAILNKDGLISNFVAVKEDITEHKKILDELIAAKEKAEESDRLKTAFLTNISHEIRTPMNGILGFSSLLKNPELSGEKQAQYIDLINQSGERMLSLINDLIDISRIEAGETLLHISSTPVNRILDDLCEFFKPEAQQKGLCLNVSKVLSDDESTIETDNVKLKQICSNLIQNALKFTRQGGISFGYTRHDDMLEFYVKDSGIGIPDDMREMIFERFHQIDNSLTRHHEGPGLGLSISKAYIELLGGTINVRSSEGKGSEFLFSLPYNPTSSSKTQIGQSVAKDLFEFLSDLTIVIAEDDKVSNLVLSTHLKHENNIILTAFNGQAAVDFVKLHPEIHIVVMDLKMPVMDGFEATRQIKKLRPELPVIAQTAFTSKEIREKAAEAGCDRFITKPINKTELLELILEILKQ